MSLIPLLVLAAASKKRNAKSTGLSRKNSHSGKQTGDFSPDCGASHLDYILKEMAYGDSHEMKSFFTKLFSYGEEIRKELNEEKKKQHQSLLDDFIIQINSQLAVLEEAERKLQQLYINLGQKTKITFGYNSHEYYYKLFNDLEYDDFRVTSDNMDDNVKNTDEVFKRKKVKLAEETAKLNNLETRKQRLLMEKAKLEKKLKYPFGKDNNISHLAEIEEELKEIENFYSNYSLLYEQVNQYEQLSDEQKVAIIEYIQGTYCLQDIISKHEHVFYNRPSYYSDVHLTFTYNYDEIDTDMWFKALSRMFERENLDLAYIDKVFDQIEQAPYHWMDKDLEMCSHGPKDFAVDSYEQLIHFFLENIYYPEYDNVLTIRVHFADLAYEQDSAKKLVK